jgi:hypothetical protein
VSFEQSDIQRRTQGLEYGSDEWTKFHQYARNGIESLNAQIKRGGTADIETASRRRARGLAVAQVFTTVLLSQHNLERIADFLREKYKVKAGMKPKAPSTRSRRRDAEWTNPYTGTTPGRVIAIEAATLRQPPQIE